MTKRHYIYLIINTINTKPYIGQSVDPAARWYKHKWAARLKPVQPISHAMANHKVENFDFNVIATGFLSCTCKLGQPGPCQIEVNELEADMMLQYNSIAPNGYNVQSKSTRYVGKGAAKGDQHWTRRDPEKLKQAQDNGLGASHPSWCKDLPTEQQPRFGTTHTKETKQQMSEIAIANNNGARLEEAGKATRWEPGCPAPKTAFKKGSIPWNKGTRKIS